MCGRLSFAPSLQQLENELSGISLPDDFSANFNIAPTDLGFVLTSDHPKQIQAMRWGLQPAWGREVKPNAMAINARAETVAEKPTFREAFQKRRCLVLADSFYEWQKVGKSRFPYRIFPKGKNLLFLAGLWEKCGSLESPLYTFTVLTTTPNAEMNPIHDRMPVILSDEKARRTWLEATNREDLSELWAQPKNDLLSMYRIGNQIGNVRDKSAAVQIPLNGLFDGLEHVGPS